CTSVSLNRVAVIKAGNKYMCSRNDCRRVENLQTSAAATGVTDSALPARCPHAE
ncbi:unnamed protein product, partial [Ectocarpus sp. 12 AP-2014]